MHLTSSVFEDKSNIPSKYTCDGENISPPLEWDDVPEDTKSFVLIVDDPDAPMGTWVHWVVFHIPGASRELPENASVTRQGTTSFGNSAYGGPCPPSGVHRYYFKLYALDTDLDLPSSITKDRVLDAMEGHVLAEAELMGRYERK